jgi:pimeloyl-ACP methyl ester carboxylesterase
MKSFRFVAVLAALLPTAAISAVAIAAPTQIHNIVLVHGGFVDGSGWSGVYRILKKDGYNVTVVQNPTITLDDDVAVAKRAIDAQPGDVILVGHSYGGMVISKAGNDPKVKGLVYISAFAPDSGDSVKSLLSHPESGESGPPILPPVDGFLLLDPTKFASAFAADVNPHVAAFMAASQVPWGVGALNATVADPAWKTKPAWYLVTKEDRMIPPRVQRMMAKRAHATVVEIHGSHSAFIARPKAAAALIERAAHDAEMQ